MISAFRRNSGPSTPATVNWFLSAPLPVATPLRVMLLPDDRRIGGKDPLPEAVAENHDRRLAGDVVFRQEQPPVERPRAEQVEQAGRRQQQLDPLGLLPPEQRGAAALGDRHLLERSVLVPDIDVLAGRRPVLGNVDPRRPQPQHGQPIGIGIRQGLQQDPVDDAEDRGIGADSDGERRDDDEGRDRAAPQHAQGVAEILEQGVHTGRYYVNSQLPTSNSQIESGRISARTERDNFRLRILVRTSRGRLIPSSRQSRASSSDGVSRASSGARSNNVPWELELEVRMEPNQWSRLNGP